MKIFNLLVTKAYAANDAVVGSDFSIPDPLKAKTIQELLLAILTLVYQVGLPVVAVMFVYAGFLYVTARGDTTKISQAHSAFTYTVIGAMVVLGASVIATIIKGTIDKLGAN